MEDPSLEDPSLVDRTQEVDASSWAAEEEFHKRLGEAAHSRLPTPSLVESGSLHHYTGDQATLKKR